MQGLRVQESVLHEFSGRREKMSDRDVPMCFGERYSAASVICLCCSFRIACLRNEEIEEEAMRALEAEDER